MAASTLNLFTVVLNIKIYKPKIAQNFKKHQLRRNLGTSCYTKLMNFYGRFNQ